MDDTQRIVKCGNLSLHTAGGFFKKRWHSKYLVLYDGSKSGVKRLELFDSEIKFKKQNAAKIIPLVDCVRVVTCQRHKTTYTFEVRTSDQFYLLAAKSFQDMSDWVNCLRLVAFGQSSTTQQTAQQLPATRHLNQAQSVAISAAASVAAKRSQFSNSNNATSASAAAAAAAANTTNGPTTTTRAIDVLLEKQTAISRTADYVRSLEQLTSDGQRTSAHEQTLATAMGGLPPEVPTDTHPALAANRLGATTKPVVTASQAAAAAASALAKTRQRQPSLLGSCKPQPPTDSPFIQQASAGPTQAAPAHNNSNATPTTIGPLDTLTPTVRGQLISSVSRLTTPLTTNSAIGQQAATASRLVKPMIQATLDEEEENMLYCSIEDNPSEHNYRVKVIESELSLRCQLKCYQLTAPKTISQQYEQLGNFNPITGAYELGQKQQTNGNANEFLPQPVTFYQLIIGPQELTLLNDYANTTSLKPASQQQGLWSWPYQCIRRYGFDKDNCFMFEAGRKCTSGPGQFIVQTPKAYNIYQDMVKFVNELRSLSTTTDSGGLLANNNKQLEPIVEHPQPQQHQQQQQKHAVITQIPVTWAPSALVAPTNRTTTAVPSTVSPEADSRQQFFNTLRQLDSSASQVAQTTSQKQQEAPSTLTSSTNTSHGQQSTATTSPSSTTDLLTSTASSPNQSRLTEPTRAAATATTPVDDQHTLASVTKSRQKCDSIAGNSEETDESGYDQGDDSVDSSTASRFKLIGRNRDQDSSVATSCVTRKRQAHDSMSSSSSTSSGGSPGQSVSRRSNGGVLAGSAFNGQGPSKRSPLKALRPINFVCSGRRSSSEETGIDSAAGQPGVDQQQLLAIRNLVNVDHVERPDDFETSLIRDVYSEITKLHAKFAVTSNSTEDSMSSHSSSNEGSSSDNTGNSNLDHDEDDNDDDDDDCINSTSAHSNRMSEPMYTNLGPPGRGLIKARVGELMSSDDRENVENRRTNSASKPTNNNMNQGRQQQQHLLAYGHHPDNQRQQVKQYQHNNSYAQNIGSNNYDYLSQKQQQQQQSNSMRCGPIYPSVLNPIPEAGELATSNLMGPSQVKAAHQQPLAKEQLFGEPIDCRSEANVGKNRSPPMATSRTLNENKPGDSTKRAPNYQGYRQGQLSTSRLANSKSPTNHYVINDVQYAKISRNVLSNFESCL